MNELFFLLSLNAWNECVLCGSSSIVFQDIKHKSYKNKYIRFKIHINKDDLKGHVSRYKAVLIGRLYYLIIDSGFITIIIKVLY